jgi:hypothetical protein
LRLDQIESIDVASSEIVAAAKRIGFDRLLITTGMRQGGSGASGDLDGVLYLREIPTRGDRGARSSAVASW